MSASGHDSPFLQLTLEKLNHMNFRVWAQSVKLIIDGKGKLGNLTVKPKKQRPPTLVLSNIGAREIQW